MNAKMMAGAVRSLLAVALAIPGVATAQIYLKIDRIDGDVTAKGYEKQIDIDSFSWGLSRPVSGGGVGSGREISRVIGSEIALTKRTDPASAGLAAALLTGKLQPKAEISFVRTVGDKVERYIHLTLCDVFVTSVSTAADGDGPVESFSLNTGAFKLEYTSFGPDGQPGSSQPVVWDFASATPGACS